MSLLDRVNALRGGAIAELDEETFDEYVSSSKVVFVDFWADWCRPCRHMAPILRSLAREYAGKIAFAKVDVEAEPALKKRFKVRAIPTYVVFKRGEVADRFSGARTRAAIAQKIRKRL